MTSADVRARVTSLCAGFSLDPCQTPFSFELQPAGVMTQAFRIEAEEAQTVGWFNYAEERTDLMRIWVARKFLGDPQAMYDRLLNDVSSLRAAVIRDGASDGSYFVPDAGSGYVIQAEPKKEYGVLRVTLPLNYECSL